MSCQIPEVDRKSDRKSRINGGDVSLKEQTTSEWTEKERPIIRMVYNEVIGELSWKKEENEFS